MDTNAFIELLFERARAAGFEACEVYLKESTSFSLGVKRGELTRYDVADSLNLGFRALRGGRLGCASTQVLDADAAQLLVDAALEGAQLVETDVEEELYAGANAYPELCIERPEIARMGAQARIELVRGMEAAALSFDSHIDSVSACGLSSASVRERLVNSRGLDLSFRRDLLRAHVCPIARRGERSAAAGRARYLNGAQAAIPAAMAREAASEALDLLDAESAATGRYPIVLRADAASDLLATFSGLFSADAAQKGLSLLRGREGEAVAAPCVNLIDDPLLPEGWGSRPFDGEGVPTRRLRLLENGRLNTLMHNLQTARRQGVKSTGSAARRSCAGPMTVAPSNLFIAPGAEDLDALCARAGRAILVTDLSGLHSGANPVSGDFSLGARGYLIEGERAARPVHQITVAGNFLELLRGVEAVGSDLDFALGDVASPSLLLAPLSVAGASD